MASDGKTVIVITHKLKEVMEIADNITVLRRGETKGTLSKTNTCEHELASLMIGKNADFQPLEKQNLPSAETPLTIRDVWAKDDFGVDKLRGISVQVKTGEIVTIAGVEGNGQTELADVLLGNAAYRARLYQHCWGRRHKQTYSRPAYALFPLFRRTV